MGLIKKISEPYHTGNYRSPYPELPDVDWATREMIQIGRFRMTEPIFWTGLALGSTLFCAGIVGLSRLLQ